MIPVLRKVHLLNGLTTAELEVIGNICSEKVADPAEVVIEQGAEGDEIYIIADGSIEVFVSTESSEKVLVMLMEGQLFGEMALISRGPRSASGRAGKDGCKMYVLSSTKFNEVCEKYSSIGHKVMRNLALDLSFKLRHQNMAAM